MRARLMIPAICLVLAAGPLQGCQREAPDRPGPGETTQGAAMQDREQPGERDRRGCESLPSAEDLRRYLVEAPKRTEPGGLMSGRMEWAAVTDRSGVLCAVAVATEDPTSAWPGSQAIAKAKAYTANAFSTDTAPMSTARLYTLSLPGHSLWGAAGGNPFNPACLAVPGDPERGVGEVCGGTIPFGGGVPLYRGNTRVGGLGVSGDTPCADHEVAKAIRDLAGLNPPGGRAADDIVYPGVDGASIYGHPLCPNTYRDGKKLGDEPPAMFPPHEGAS
ncbi:MAG TPA: heme-binding protein [Methylomirabilota bacterium]